MCLSYITEGRICWIFLQNVNCKNVQYISKLYIIWIEHLTLIKCIEGYDHKLIWKTSE